MANSGGGEHRPSTGQDMVKGRRTEIPFLNGFVARKGEEIGIPTPTNAILTDIVLRVEHLGARNRLVGHKSGLEANGTGGD